MTDRPGRDTDDGRGSAARGSNTIGRALAGLLILALAFGAGLVVGQSGPGASGRSAVGSSPAASPGPGASSSVPTAPPSGPTAPPPAETPATEPRATEPPATEPPATEPPATEPPATEPPAATGPPATSPVAGSTVPPDAPPDIGLLWEALRLIRERYVGRAEVDDTALTYGALAGLVEALGDTGHSVFLTPEDLAAEREGLQGRVVGIGAFLGEESGRPVIVSVIPNAPADRAGIRSGDVIVAVDGRRVDRLSAERISSLVRGEAGTELTLTVARAGESEPLEFTMTRERIELDPVTWTMVPGTNIADVRLIQFSEGAGAAVAEALTEAREAGAEGIVLDLRSNPGGFVHEAVNVASEFIDEGTVYIRQDASGTETPVPADPGGVALDIPLVVLIDLGTASSAEIVAAAIIENERGPAVGTTTFGTGTVLLTFELSDGSAVRLGVERWLTPDGDLIFEQGVEPTEVVELTAEARPLEPGEIADMTPEELAASGDTQLLRALELLGGSTTRTLQPT